MDFCTLFSGSSGNCTYLAQGQTKLLIDAGMSMKAISQALSCMDIGLSQIRGILITHEHIDHIRGLGPIVRKYQIPVYANEQTARALQTQCGFACPQDCIFENGRPFFLGDWTLTPFSTPHDSADSVGFRCVSAAGGILSVATDLGRMDASVLQALCGADIVLLEANHDEAMVRESRYPAALKQRILSDRGHLSNENSARAVQSLVESGTKQIVLGHLSRENNFPRLAYRAVERQMQSAGISLGDFSLSVAPRESPGELLHHV